MKILVLNWQDINNPFAGGAEVQLHEIFKRIVAKGHAVTLYCCHYRGALKEEVIDGIRVIRSGSRNLFNFTVAPRYRKQFRHEGYDIVVDDINKIPFYTPQFIQEPLVGIVHHLFGQSIFLETSLPAALYVALAERRATKVYRTTPIAVVSESTKQELIGYGFSADNLFIVQNCVDHTLYHPIPGSEKDNFLLGSLGRIKKYKSIDHLLKAFKIVLGEVPQAKLMIIGDGDARQELERLTKDLKIERAVQFTGHVAAQEKVRLLNRMDVIVNCSVKEGWGLTVIEANACGVPVIASDVPGLRDSVIDEKTGFLYEYGNIEQLAEKILLVLRDEHLRNRLSEQSLQWAHSFNWEDSTQKMLDVMEQVIKEKR
ncbi:MAG: glycosyltransferase family 4 protein [bacterium]